MEIHNSAPTKAVVGMTPLEMWDGRKPDLSSMRVFGCRALAYDHLDKPKFGARAVECFYLGPATGGDGHKLFNPSTNRVFASRSVRFFEKPVKVSYEHASPSSPSPYVDIDTLSPDQEQSSSEESSDASSDSDTDWSLPRISLTNTGNRGGNSSSPLMQDRDEPIQPQEEEEEEEEDDPPLMDNRGGSSGAKVSFTDTESDGGGEGSSSSPLCKDRQPPPSTPEESPTTDKKGKQRRDDPHPKPHVKVSHEHKGGKRSSLLYVDRNPSSTPPATRTFSRPGRGEKAPRPRWVAEKIPAKPRGNDKAMLADQQRLMEPTSYQDALDRPDTPKWKASMDAEMQALWSNKTWKLSLLPKGRKAVGSKWVYKIKKGLDLQNPRYKSRLVAKGYLQRKGIDYTETFAPVARTTSMRVILAVAANEGLALETIDVDNAYLNGVIDAKVYMTQPEGYVDPKFPAPTWVCELQKSLYGLKQAGKIWNDTIHSYIIEMGFTRTSADPCVYIHVTKEKQKVIIGLHVDDFIVAGHQGEIEWLKEQLKKRYRIKSSVATLCLGIQIYRSSDGAISLSQSNYIRDSVIECGLEKANPKNIPLPTEAPRTMMSAGTQAKACTAAECTLYRRIIGKMNYAAVGTRPDISFTVGLLGRYMQEPNTLHLSYAKHAMCYLKGTMNARLQMPRGSGTLSLQGYVDSDWAGTQGRRSTSGYVFFVNGSTISWLSKRQSTVATSSAEAEYIAMTDVTKEAIWLRRLLTDLGYPQEGATPIFEDNLSCIKYTQADANHNRSKHIDVRYHFTREKITEQVIKILRTSSEDQPADMLTKPQAKPRFLVNCKQISLDILVSSA